MAYETSSLGLTFPCVHSWGVLAISWVSLSFNHLALLGASGWPSCLASHMPSSAALAPPPGTLPHRSGPHCSPPSEANTARPCHLGAWSYTRLLSM